MAKKLDVLESIVAAFGAVGIALSAMGFCLCFFIPVLSAIGFTAIFAGLLTNNGFYLLLFGILLLIVSYILKKHVVNKNEKV